MPWSLNNGYLDSKKSEQERQANNNRRRISNTSNQNQWSLSSEFQPAEENTSNNTNNRIDRICYSASEYLSKYSHTEIVVLFDCPGVIRIIAILYGQDLMGTPCGLKYCFAVRRLESIQAEQAENLASTITNRLSEIKPELIDEEFTVTEHDARSNILDFTHEAALPNDSFLDCTDGRCLIVHPSELNLDTFSSSRDVFFY